MVKIVSLLAILKITVQRFYLLTNISLTDRKFDVHGFSDASKNAYAAVVYLACSNYSIFLASKTRVSPLQATSIPRLELMACLLLSELIEIVLSSICNSINIKNVNCWSDSFDSLIWIKGENKNWKPFIENRVIKMRKIVHPSKWRFFPGNKNPADLPSRGTCTPEFCSDIFCNWNKGPTFITKDESCWQVDASNSYLPQDVQIVNVNVMKSENNYGIQNLIDISRFNDYLKLLRITAYVIRFVNNLKQKGEKQSLKLQFLQPIDIENAEFEWIRIAQKEFSSNKSYFNQLKIKFGVFFDK